MQPNPCSLQELFEIPDSYIILDLETTGLSFQKDQIIEIGALRIEKGQIKEQWHSLICPDFSVLEGNSLSDYVSSLTGITEEMLLSAPPFAQKAASLFSFLEKLPIAGHRVDFDLAFLSTAFSQHLGLSMANPYFDTLYLSQKLLPELPHHRLKDLAAYYAIDYSGAHRALRDCEITAQCLTAMAKTAHASFSSPEEFSAHWHLGKRRLSAADLPAPAQAPLKNHPFYRKNIVITGILYSLSRRAAMLKIAAAGGINQDKVTIFTDYLIQGDGHGTSKAAKALRLIQEGCPIKLLSEAEFIELF